MEIDLKLKIMPIANSLTKSSDHKIKLLGQEIEKIVRESPDDENLFKNIHTTTHELETYITVNPEVSTSDINQSIEILKELWPEANHPSPQGPHGGGDDPWGVVEDDNAAMVDDQADINFEVGVHGSGDDPNKR